jgi:hypothetical protein
MIRIIAVLAVQNVHLVKLAKMANAISLALQNKLFVLAHA